MDWWPFPKDWEYADIRWYTSDVYHESELFMASFLVTRWKQMCKVFEWEKPLQKNMMSSHVWVSEVSIDILSYDIVMSQRPEK